MKKLTVNQIKELQKRENFTIQKLFNVKNENLQDFLEEVFNFQILINMLPAQYKKYNYEISKDGYITIS